MPKETIRRNPLTSSVSASLEGYLVTSSTSESLVSLRFVQATKPPRSVGNVQDKTLLSDNLPVLVEPRSQTACSCRHIEVSTCLRRRREQSLAEICRPNRFEVFL
eukprot:746090-Hanusia_phi.AAC.12